MASYVYKLINKASSSIDSVQIIQTIFCPNNDCFLRLKDSLQSLNKCVLPTNCSIYMDGWVRDDTMWRELNQFIDKLNIRISYVNRRSKNVGKSKIINTLCDIGKHQLVLYIDSDIILDKYTIMDLLDIEKKINIKAIFVPNQKEDCRHNLFIQDIKDLTYKSRISTNKDCLGISGGVFLCRRELIEKNPFEDKGPYSPDDVSFFERNIKNGIYTFICLDIYVTHPFDKNDEYCKWKHEMSLKLYHKDLSEREKQEIIEQSEKFWEKQIN